MQTNANTFPIAAALTCAALSGPAVPCFAGERAESWPAGSARAASQDTPTTKPALLAELGADFRLHRTKHFVLAHNTPAKLARQVAERMEQTYGTIIAFCKYLRINAAELDRPLQALLFDRYGQYAEYGKSVGFETKATRGFYDEGANRSAFYNAFNDPAVQELNDKIKLLEASRTQQPERLGQLRRQIDRHAATVLQTALRHEVAHQVTYNCGILRRAAPTPIWLAEGLACLFEIKDTNPRHRLPINRPRLERFEQDAAAEELLPLGALLTANRQSSPALTQSETFYAQSWALCYHVARHRPRQFAAYLAAVRARRPGQEVTPKQEFAAFQASFGQPDARFEQTWLKAMRRLKPGKNR